MPFDANDVYPLFVQDTARLSDRRQSMNALYLSVNSLLLGAIALLAQQGGLTNILFLAAEFIIAVAGIIIAAQWRRLIDKYRDLLKLRYALLIEMENQKPFPSATKVYTSEAMEKLYGFSEIERRLPMIFQWVYGTGTAGLLAGVLAVHFDIGGAVMKVLPYIQWFPYPLNCVIKC